jgi:hypothetical protein
MSFRLGPSEAVTGTVTESQAMPVSGKSFKLCVASAGPTGLLDSEQASIGLVPRLDFD